MMVIDSVSMVFGSSDGPDGTPAALQDVSLTVETGEFITIIGPSGCGKSTLLSCIAGFLSCTSGQIVVDGDVVDGPAPGRAVVFQQASLLPWRTVSKNISYGMELQRKLNRREIAQRVEEAVHAVGLAGYEKFYPHQISGGMQQRVNLARALATRPSLLLMDEPFGALDAFTKETLQDELLGIAREEQCTTIFITHDIDEAVFLGDRVVVMSANPGCVAHVQESPFSRPRHRSLVSDPAFTAIVRDLRPLLHRTETAPESLVVREPNSAIDPRARLTQQRS